MEVSPTIIFQIIKIFDENIDVFIEIIYAKVTVKSDA